MHYQVTKPFIGMLMQKDDFNKVINLLPTPTYITHRTSIYESKILIVYELKYHLTSPKSYKWFSDIKINFKKHTLVDFELIDSEFYVNDNTICNGAIYTLNELSKVYVNTNFIKYPSILFPQSPKELYQKLSWYGAKLYYYEKLNKDILMSVALQMNNVFNSNEKLQYKELFKKVIQVYEFIIENQDNYKKKLTPNNLKKSLQKGGQIRANQNKEKAKANEKNIKELLKDPNFKKQSGKPKINEIAISLNLNRKTVSRVISKLSFVLLYAFIGCTFSQITSI